MYIHFYTSHAHTNSLYSAGARCWAIASRVWICINIYTHTCINMHVYTFLHVTRTHELSILSRSKTLSDCVASTKMYKHIYTYIYQYACIYIFSRHTHTRTLYTEQEQDAERLRREYELLLNGMRGLYPPPLPWLTHMSISCASKSMHSLWRTHTHVHAHTWA